MDWTLNQTEILEFEKPPTESYPNRERDNQQVIPAFSPAAEFRIDNTVYQMTSSHSGRITSFAHGVTIPNKIYLLTIDGITSDEDSDLDFYDLAYTLYKDEGFYSLDQLTADAELSNYAYELIVKTLREYIGASVTPSSNEHWNVATENSRKNVMNILERFLGGSR